MLPRSCLPLSSLHAGDRLRCKRLMTVTVIVKIRALSRHFRIFVLDLSLGLTLTLVHLSLCLLHHFLVKFVDILKESLSIDRFRVFTGPDLIEFRFHTAYFEFKFTDIFCYVLVSRLSMVGWITEVLGVGLRLKVSHFCLLIMAQLGDVV